MTINLFKFENGSAVAFILSSLTVWAITVQPVANKYDNCGEIIPTYDGGITLSLVCFIRNKYIGRKCKPADDNNLSTLQRWKILMFVNSRILTDHHSPQ